MHISGASGERTGPGRPVVLPHALLRWTPSAGGAEQAGETVMFTLVALTAGFLGDRLRTERRRYRNAARVLRSVCARLHRRAQERSRLDRLVTIGHVASGIAHEIRTPLAGLLGAMEILETEFEHGHPKAAFLALARREIRKLQEVVSDFLEFAHPPPPTVQSVELGRLCDATARLARPALSCRGADLVVRPGEAGVTAHADAYQLQRALLNLMLADPSLAGTRRIILESGLRGADAHIRIIFEGPSVRKATDHMFEPFRAEADAPALTLAIARRLIENQHGAIDAATEDGRLIYAITIPRSGPDASPQACAS